LRVIGSVARRPVSALVRAGRIVRRGSFSMRATPGRRLLLALLVVLATAALLAALFPEVRSDFGLGRADKSNAGKAAKRQPPAHAPAREHTRDKTR
jgi:hypothetical protein